MLLSILLLLGLPLGLKAPVMTPIRLTVLFCFFLFLLLLLFLSLLMLL